MTADLLLTHMYKLKIGMSIRILLTEIIKWMTSSKKKIINSSDNYHYHKLDIRKSETVFRFRKKRKLSHKGKEKD